MSILDRATRNSSTLFANLGMGQGSLFILDNDFAWPPYEWSKVPDVDTGKHFRIMPADFNGKEWLESIEPKHFHKTPYWMQKHVSMWQDRDIWLFGCSFHGNVNSGTVALFLEAYRSRVDNSRYMLIASTSSEYIQHFASMWQIPGDKAWWSIISSGDAQTTEQYGAYWLHELWQRIALYEGSPPLEQYKTFLPTWIVRNVT